MVFALSRRSDGRTATEWIPGFTAAVPEPDGGSQRTVQPLHGGQPQPLSSGQRGRYSSRYGHSHFSTWIWQVCRCVTFPPVCLFPGETEQSYYGSDGQRQPPSFWPQYSSPGFTAPQPHPPLASCPSDSTEQYCPRVAKRKNSHPQRPEREGHVTAMSAYPGRILNDPRHWVVSFLFYIFFSFFCFSICENDALDYVFLGELFSFSHHVLYMKLQIVHLCFF